MFFSCGRTKIRTSPEDRNSFITVNNDTRNKDLVNFLDEISLQTLSYTEKVEEELEKKTFSWIQSCKALVERSYTFTVGLKSVC